jgi:hypothetical protein
MIRAGGSRLSQRADDSIAAAQMTVGGRRF